jgi:hypothetical protein
MVPFIWVYGVRVKLQLLADLLLVTGIATKETGITIKPMEITGSTITLMELAMKVNGLRTSSRAKVRRTGQMEAAMSGSTSRGRSTGSESSHGVMGLHMRESGCSTRCMEKARSGGQMEGGTRESIKMIRNMEGASLRIQMGEEKKVYGSMGNT